MTIRSLTTAFVFSAVFFFLGAIVIGAI